MGPLGYISDKVIANSLSATSQLAITAPGKRGKHKSKHVMTGDQKDFVVKHIKLFHPQISHYHPENVPKRLYLSPVLKTNEMYGDYLEKCDDKKKR